MPRHKGGPQHLVAFYGNAEARLARSVAGYLSACLTGGGGVIIIASPQRKRAITEALVVEAPVDDRVLWIDPVWALGQFMVAGRADARRFETVVGNPLRAMQRQYPSVCAYGEMVGCLWQQGAFTAAVALEQLWNELLEKAPCDLICGYPIDVLGEEFQIGSVSALLSAHSQVVPSLSPAFDLAMREALDEVLGHSHEGLRGLPRCGSHQVQLAEAPVEATMLRLRHSLPRYVDEIITSARRRYEKTA